MSLIVYSDGSFALRAQVGSVLRASGTIDGTPSGVISVLIPEVDTRVEVSLGMMTNASYGSVSGRILEAGGFVGAADAILHRADVFAGLDSGGATFSNRVVGTVISDSAGNFSFSCSSWNFEIYAYRQSTWQETRVSGELVRPRKTVSLVFPEVNGEVYGVVLDGAGDAVEGARVFVGPFETETASDGSFTVTGLPRVANLNVAAQDVASPAAVNQRGPVSSLLRRSIFNSSRLGRLKVWSTRVTARRQSSMYQCSFGRSLRLPAKPLVSCPQ